MSQSHTVICTAGHIDHGKSSLIECLTGYHPDVLQEEREREMTIELGFAFYNDDVTFIDVPGHEKFLKTMLAGASGVDGAILVIAADDGIMPQTREHFEILRMMGIQEGIVALTKIDLAEEEWVELVIDDIRDLVKGTFLESAPIMPVSNRSKAGMDDFRKSLNELIERVPSRKDRGLFRMWLDRAFTIKGSGTVVAGTVLSGSGKLNDRVEILPAGTIARIKRIQVHKNDVEKCSIGERAALNLPGIDKDNVKRGDLLATPDHYRPSFMLNARIHLMPNLVKPIENRYRIRLHLGSSEIIGRLSLLEGDAILPGESSLIQFRLESQAMADVGDRFVVRSFSEGRVIGGGIILETRPKKMRHAKNEELLRLRRLESAEPHEIVTQHLDKVEHFIADAETIAHETAFLFTDIVDILSAMHRDNEIKIIDPDPKWGVVLLTRYNELKTLIINYIDDFHKLKPNLQGARRSDLKSRLMPKAHQKVFDAILIDLSDTEKFVVSGEIVRRSDFQIKFSAEQEKYRDQINNMFLNNLFNPPNQEEICDAINADWKSLEPIFTGMVELDVITRLFTPEGKPIFYHADAIHQARNQLIEFFGSHAEMRFFEFRELIGSSRKFTTPILMLFDDEGLTIREGEVRKLRK